MLQKMKRRSPRFDLSEPPSTGESGCEEHATRKRSAAGSGQRVAAPPQQQSSSPTASCPAASASAVPTQPRWFFRKSTWLQIILPVIILTRCGFNIHWLHSRWLKESFTSITQLPPYGMRRTTFVHHDNNEPTKNYKKKHDIMNTIEEEDYDDIYPEEFDATTTSTRKQPPDDQLQRLDQRRRERQQRTRPLRGNQNDNNSNEDDSATSSDLNTGYWVSRKQKLNISPEQDWQALCRNASLSSTSRVVISGILSQPPSQALALLIAHQCKVTTIAGVDPLFPNIRQQRLQQMDDYRVLKRGIANLKLIVPAAITSSNSSDDGDNDGDGVVQQLYEFDPTHVILVETFVPNLYKMMDELRANYYMAKYRLKLVNDALITAATATATSGAHAGASSKQQQKPKPTCKFVHVTSDAVSDHLTSHFQTVLTRTYHGLYGFSVVQLQLPGVYGPFVTEGNDPDTFELARNVTTTTTTNNNDDEEEERLYVDEAISAILQSLQVSSGWIKMKAQSTLYSVAGSINSSNDDEVAAIDLDEVISFRESETKTWMSRNQYDHLGNAHIEAQYIDTFGVPRARFPCSSKCESVRCIPSAFESIQTVAQETTEGCNYVLYMVDFTRDIKSLEEPRRDKEEIDHDAEPQICRVAFVSGKSKLVRNAIRQAHEDDDNAEITMDALLLSENGNLIMNSWRVVWLPDDDEESLSKSDLARLRVDPAGMFAPSVTRAMYTQQRAFMKARISQLNDTFAEMTRSRRSRRVKKVRRPGTNVFQKTVIPRQRSRRVIFLAKEPKSKELPESVADFVSEAETPIPPKQVEFYEESEALIFSYDMRPVDNIEDTDYDSIPYYWISPKFFLHDLKTKHSQELRCSWYKEYLHWNYDDDVGSGGGGGDLDGELLSFAYVMGKGRLMDRFGDRDEESTSWIPVMDPDYPGYRLKNARGWELFIRIQQS